MNKVSHTSFYQPLEESNQHALLEEYLTYLQKRNGPLDKQTGTLPRREESLIEMDSSELRSSRPVKQADFDRLYDHAAAGDSALTPELLLLLTFCKMNAGEAYGVRVVKAVHGKRDRGKTDLRNRVIQVAQEEEEYHTRILVGAAHHFDISVSGEYRPKWALKALIYSIAYAPRPLFHPILFASEVVGVYIFNWTLNQIGSHCQGQPALQQALEQRLIEILVDEIGHVAFNRLVMGPAGRQLGHSLAYQTVRGMTTITPELSVLGFDHQAERGFGGFEYTDLPEEVRRRGFFA